MFKKLAYFIILLFVQFKSYGFDIKAPSVILQDFLSGKILYEKEADMSIYPASMTKIMTSIIAFDLLKKNQLSLDDLFVVSENAWRLSQSDINEFLLWFTMK